MGYIQVVATRFQDSTTGEIEAVPKAEAPGKKFVYIPVPSVRNYQPNVSRPLLLAGAEWTCDATYSFLNSGNPYFSADASATYVDITLPFATKNAQVRTRVGTSLPFLTSFSLRGFLGGVQKEVISVEDISITEYNFSETIDRIRVQWSSPTEGIIHIPYFELVLKRYILYPTVILSRYARRAANENTEISYEIFLGETDINFLPEIMKYVPYGLRFKPDEDETLVPYLSSPIYVERVRSRGPHIIMFDGKSNTIDLSKHEYAYFSAGGDYIPYFVRDICEGIGATNDSVYLSNNVKYAYPQETVKGTLDQISKEGGMIYSIFASSFYGCWLHLPGKIVEPPEAIDMGTPVNISLEGGKETRVPPRPQTGFSPQYIYERFDYEGDPKVNPDGLCLSVISHDIRDQAGNPPHFFSFADGIYVNERAGNLRGTYIDTYSVKKQKGDYLYGVDTGGYGRLDRAREVSLNLRFIGCDKVLKPGDNISYKSLSGEDTLAQVLSVTYTAKANEISTEVEVISNGV